MRALRWDVSDGDGMESWTWRWDGVMDMEMGWSHGHGDGMESWTWR